MMITSPGTSLAAFLTRIVLVLVIAGLVWLLGWTQGANSAAKEAADIQASLNAAVSGRIQQNTKIEAAQAAVSSEVSHEVESRIVAVRRHYADRVRQPAPVRVSPVPKADGSAGSAHADPSDPGSTAASSGGGLRVESYESLAERCAVTTVIALGWQQREAALQALDVE